MNTNNFEKSKNGAENSMIAIVRALTKGRVFLGVGFLLLIAIMCGGLSFVNRVPPLTIDSIAGVTLSPYEYPILLPDTQVKVVSGLFNSAGYNGSFAINGKIQVGVILDSPDTLVEQLSSTKYRITLPEASVTFCSLDDPIQFDWSKSLVADWEKAEDFARYSALATLKTSVVESDLTLQTEYKVQQVLSNFVEAINPNYELEFVFKDLGETRFDTTCQAVAPSGWDYDPAKNEWTPQ